MQDKTLQDRTMTDKLAGPDIVLASEQRLCCLFIWIIRLIYRPCQFVRHCPVLQFQSTQIGYIMPQEQENISCRGQKTTQTHHKTMRQYNKPKKIISTLRPGLSGDNPLATVRLRQRVFLANHLAITNNLARTTKRQNTQQRRPTIHKRGTNKQQYNIKHANIYNRQS